MATDVQNLTTYLRAYLTDPMGRGYPTASGLHWIYATRPEFSFASVGYPIIYCNIPNESTIGFNQGMSLRQRNTFSIEVFATKISHIDSIRDDLKAVLKECPQSSLPGLFGLRIESTQVVPNVVEDTNVYQMIVNISYKSFEV